MSHAIQAFITRDPDVGILMSGHGRTFGLSQGYILLPLTDELLSQLGIPMLAFDEDDRPGQFLNIDVLGRDLSLDGAAAYIEAVKLGPLDYQGAIAWSRGDVAVQRSKNPGALEDALKALGGEAWTSENLFNALHLGQYKSTNDWRGTGTSS